MDKARSDNVLMHTESDKVEFSKRLNLALKSLPNQPLNAAQIATQFNLRYSKEPISPQAVHKWLTGQSFPTVDKVRTLSEWLNVSYEWLRYGVKQELRMSDIDKLMLEYFQKLNPTQKQAFLNLIIEVTKK